MAFAVDVAAQLGLADAGYRLVVNTGNSAAKRWIAL